MRHRPAFILVLPAAMVAVPAWSHHYSSREEAQTALFPEATRFVDATVRLSGAQREAISKESGVKQRWDTQAVWRAEREGTLLGWFIVDQVIGKHEFITYATAIGAEGQVRGVEILDYRETYGFEVREAAWRERFKGKRVGDALEPGTDIPTITGATLSCRNVTRGVHRLLVLHKLVLADAARP
jgi:Na+-translocating ferredoxin:NAD+ oxidoreductase RnfG subunit